MDNITEEERKVVDELRKRTINDMTPKLLEDDTVFYRFAKARDFNLEDAESMLRKHISWRKEWQIDTILTDYEPPEVLLKYTGSSFICFDKEGCIVRIQDFGRVDPKGLCNAATKIEAAKFSVFLGEQDKALLIKKGGNLRKPIYAPLYDFEDFTYSKAVHLKGIQYLAYSTKIILDNNPETVKTITVINTPIFFTWFYAAIKTILPATVTQKIRIFGTDGWKETLLKDIDSDDLPAYLGGNKTDPDGNPLCKTFIQRGQTIPKSYYKQNEAKRLLLVSDAEKITVMPFSKEEITFEMTEENSYLDWEFEIKNGDIDFSLKYGSLNSENLEPVELIPKQRINTSLESDKGFFKCEKIGNYTMVFDNSYSWFHSKEVYYKAGKRNPKNIELYNST